MRFIGRSMRGWRAGAEYRVGEDIRFATAARTIEISSPAFEFGEPIPDPHGSPPLRWSGVPPGAVMLALVVQDVDAPLLRPLTHAIAYDIDPALTSLEAGALDGTHEQVTMGHNAAGKRGYIDPSPIPGHGLHRYVFTLLALSYVPRFDQIPTKGRLIDAIAGHVIALGETMGTVER